MRPKLIHPVDVTIRRADPTSTSWDPDFNEPAAGAQVNYLPAENIRAQVRLSDFERINMTLGGDDPSSSGAILYKRGSIVSLKKGDKITEIGGMPVEVYVTEVQPAAAGRNVFHLERAVFSDRRSS